MKDQPMIWWSFWLECWKPTVTEIFRRSHTEDMLGTHAGRLRLEQLLSMLTMKTIKVLATIDTSFMILRNIETMVNSKTLKTTSLSNTT